MLLPIALASCSSGASFEDVKAKVDTIDSSIKYPYYRVIGHLDFNGEITDVDEQFVNEPSVDSFVPYARYNDGFYCPAASVDEQALGEEDTVIFAMASHSYWLRAPMRITKDNFYVVDENGVENKTCAHSILAHIIMSYMDEPGAVNPDKNKIHYTLTESGGFTMEAIAVHTKIYIDNYPFYPDDSKHHEIYGWTEDDPDYPVWDPTQEDWPYVWDPSFPLPCYKNLIDAKVNIRFEYDAEGWLVKESLKTIDYDYNKASPSQIALSSVYSYKFS